MKITVDRFTSDRDATVSLVKVDGKFVCFGLEDEYREDKVAGETRVPAGTYRVGLRQVGGFHSRYSARFNDIHRGMLQVQDVPGFEYILIHVGNTDKDTAGCLLVGLGTQCAVDEKSIQHSVRAYRQFYVMVREPARRGNLTIEYVDLDRLPLAA